MEIFLLRHASPDWNRTDIPYGIPPGPPLSKKGEKEARALAEFLKRRGVVKVYFSPFERCARTAQIISDLNGIPRIEDTRLSEWRRVDETEAGVGDRMVSIFNQAKKESAEIGPIGLVSHSGPVGVLLRKLRINRVKLWLHRKRFDHYNPMPPAGAWQAEQDSRKDSWDLKLEFIPKVD